MATDKEIITHVTSLVQLDIDAIHAYEQAIKEIEVQEIREKLSGFKADHLQHVTDLSPFIVQRGGRAPEFKPDFKGFIIQGFTALRSKLGTDGALKAMKGNEKLTNAVYDKALSWELPEDIREVIQKNREDERKHLKYIEDTLNQRAQESGKHVA